MGTDDPQLQPGYPGFQTRVRWTVSYAMKFLWPFIVASIVDGASITGAQNALLDRARRQSMENPGVPLDQPAPPWDYWPTEIGTVSREATVVLVARLSKLRSYVAPAGDHILTDYEIRAPRVIAGALAHDMA